MPSSTTQVDQSTFGEQDDVPAGLHGEPVYLGFDVDGLDRVGLEPGYVNLDVEVTDAASLADVTSESG